MSANVSEWIVLYRFTSGRRELAAAKMGARAAERAWTELAARCAEAVAFERALRDLERRYRAGRGRGADPRLATLDAQIDRTVGGLYRAASEMAAVLGPEDGAAAQALVEAAFPDGASRVTLLGYADQAGEVGDLLALLEGETHGGTVEALGLGPAVARLRALHTEFRGLLGEGPTSYPGWDDVRTGRAEGQRRLVELVARVLGRFPTAAAEDAEARSHLLAPVREQNDAIRAHLRDRRRVPDVDPATGEETAAEADEDGLPAPAPEAPVATA